MGQRSTSSTRGYYLNRQVHPRRRGRAGRLPVRPERHPGPAREVLGTEVFHASGIGHHDETGQLRILITELEQTILDLRQQLQERAGELDAAAQPTAASWPSPTGNPLGPDSAPHLPRSYSPASKHLMTWDDRKQVNHT